MKEKREIALRKAKKIFIIRCCADLLEMEGIDNSRILEILLLTTKELQKIEDME
jgi:hypothetical protein